MFRQGINCRLAFLLFLPLFFQASCGSAQVLGIPLEEAAEFLRRGDTAFIRQSEALKNFNSQGFYSTVSRLKQLSLIHPAAPFYAGLLIDEDSQEENAGSLSGRELKKLLFCAALESPSVTARREAALKLLPFALEAKNEKEAQDFLGALGSGSGREKTEVFSVLNAACLYRLGRFSEVVKLLPVDLASAKPAQTEPIAEWERALALFAAWRLLPDEYLKLNILTFLFETLLEELRQWAYTEALSSEGLLSQEEQKILEDRLSPVNYRITLNNLRPALSDGGSVFLRYPDLIAVLGRAYQYTPAMREEGAKLFQNWDMLLEAETQNSELHKTRKYLVLFYAGRIERAREEFARSSEYFMRALQFAPNAIQADACIWYALMNTLTKYPSTAALTVLSTMPQWNDVSYFADILDRLSCYLLGRRQWATLLEVFYGLENRNTGSSLAQYAWIIGRAVQEGYLKTDREAESFFRIAFEAGNASFYYRAMAASKLGLSFAPAGEIPETEKNALSTAARKAEDRKTEAEFILGLFEYGAASFALPYLNAREAELSIPELRAIAETLAASDRLKESLDLIFRYTSREAYEICLQDLYLFYPQPYRELIEKYARESELEPEILYGLIRTESYFMPGAVSRSGAVGLAQLMPATATEMAGRIARRGGPDYSGQGMDLKDPELNIHIGSYYLRYLTEQMGSPMLAILAYNGGMGRVRRWLSADRQLGGLPQDLFLETIEFTETREYGRRVLAAAAVYGYLYY